MAEGLGSELRGWRAARGLSAAEVARRADVSRVTLHRWEAGAVAPNAAALVRLLEVLAVVDRERTRVLAETAPRSTGLELVRSPIGSPVHVGQAIRSMRSHARVTQSELARQAGVSQAAVAKWETGASRPTSDALDRALAALRSSPEEAAWVRRLAQEDPVPLRRLEEAQAWLDAHRPDPRDPGVVRLLAFERAVWGRAAHDPRWETLLAETVSWRTLAHDYAREQPAADEAARSALALARSFGAWDHVQSSVIRLHGPRFSRRFGVPGMVRTFEEYLSRVKRPFIRAAVQNELSFMIMGEAPERSESLAWERVEESPPIVTERFNDATVRDDGLNALMDLRYLQDKFEEVMRLFEGMDCVRAGRPENFSRAQTTYLAAAHRIGARPLPGSDRGRADERSSPFQRDMWRWLDEEIERHS